MDATVSLWGLLLAFVATAYVIGHYNHLVMLKHNVAKAWANIDVLLKQRNEELTKLVAVCRPYMAHEAQLLERLAAARDSSALARERQRSASQSIPSVVDAEVRVRASVQQLLLRAEAYPKLQADEALRAVANRIAELETTIAARREFYNHSVRIGNASIEQFPGNLYARLFDLPIADYFEPTRHDRTLGKHVNG